MNDLASSDASREQNPVECLLEALTHGANQWAARGSSVTGIRRGEYSNEIDLWAPSEHEEEIVALMITLGFVPIAGGTSWRPQHIQFRHRHGNIVEWLFGDLALGSIRLLAEDTITITHSNPPVLDPVGRFVDGLPRRIALAKEIGPDELTRSRTQWLELSPHDRAVVDAALTQAFGKRLGRRLRTLVSSTGADVDLAKTQTAIRRHIGFAVVRNGSAYQEAAKRIRQKLRPLPTMDERSVAGVLVALIGTDGTGKTTSVNTLRTHIEEFGLTCHDEYFGRTRGNLPGIARLRQGIETREASTSTATGPRPKPQRFIGLRKVASLYYAGEYALRYWRKVAPRIRRGEVVILDRFIYDLAVMPHASSRALPLAKRLVPRPDLVFLLNAPADEIHKRKPERTAEEIARRQSVFHTILEATNPIVEAAVLSTSANQPSDFSAIGRIVATASFRKNTSESLRSETIAQLLSAASTRR